MDTGSDMHTHEQVIRKILGSKDKNVRDEAIKEIIDSPLKEEVAKVLARAVLGLNREV